MTRAVRHLTDGNPTNPQFPIPTYQQLPFLV